MRFEIPFYGHVNITSLHPKTIEITTEPNLTPQGDCIIGVSASCGCKEIPEKIKKRIRDPDSKITITIQANGSSFKITGKGHPDLKLENPHDIVIRKSNFVCPRTLAVGCDHASNDIPQKMIKSLQDSKTKGLFVIEVT